MRSLHIPKYDALQVYQTCIDSIDSSDLRMRLEAVKSYIETVANDYEEKAPHAALYQITAFVGKDEDIVIGNVTKDELKKVYSNHMVGENKPARKIYDDLKLKAPLNLCPFCGFGQVATLDHYLPKAKYPCLSVLPINLVPSCSDCNKGKSAGVATVAGKQCIHPYFDHDQFTTEQWLYAEVLKTAPASIKYFVDPPEHWSAVNKERVRTHFSDFKLSSRFAIQAANELTTLKDLLLIDFQINGKSGVQRELTKKATVFKNRHNNSWETAMYQALAASDWYCQDGFNLTL